MIARRHAGACLGSVALLLAACGGDDDAAPTAPGDVGGAPSTGSSATAGTAAPSLAATGTPTSAGAPGTTTTALAARCLVRLHGKSGAGGPTVQEGDVTVVSPDGNAEGWGGRQWLYFPEAQYTAARDVVTAAVEPCERIIIDGFSNGAAFAAKLYCRGETFDGRLVGVVVDDPVPDAAVLGCDPDTGVDVTLYWTGALETTATAGWDCTEGDWTCEGGTTIGIDAYAEALGVTPTPSPFDEHQWYVDAPETRQW